MHEIDVRTILLLNHELQQKMASARSPLMQKKLESEKVRLSKLFAFYTKNLNVPRMHLRAAMGSNARYMHQVVSHTLQDMKSSPTEQWLREFGELREWVTTCTNGRPCISFPMERVDMRENEIAVQRHIMDHPTPMFIEGAPETMLQTPAVNYGNTGEEDDDETDEDDDDDENDEIDEKLNVNESVENLNDNENDEIVENVSDNESDKNLNDNESVENLNDSESDENLHDNESDENLNDNESVENVSNNDSDEMKESPPTLHGEELRGEVFRKLDEYPNGIHYNEMSTLVNYHDPNRIRIILSGADRTAAQKEALPAGGIALALGNGFFINKKFITSESIPDILQYQKKFHPNLAKLESLLRKELDSNSSESNNDKFNFDRQIFIYNLDLDDDDKARIRTLGKTDRVRDAIMKQISNIKAAVKMIANEKKIEIPAGVSVEKVAIESFRVHEKEGKPVGRVGVRKVWESIMEHDNITRLLEKAELESTPDLVKIAEKVYEDTGHNVESSVEILKNMNQTTLS